MHVQAVALMLQLTGRRQERRQMAKKKEKKQELIGPLIGYKENKGITIKCIQRLQFNEALWDLSSREKLGMFLHDE